MTHPPITVSRRLWRDNKTGERSHVVVVRQGQLFVRIPIDSSLYDIANELVDQAEQHERAQQGRRQP